MSVERLLAHRVVNHAGDEALAIFQRDRYGEGRHAVDEIGRSVERIHDPAMLCGLRLRRTLLGHDRVIGESCQ